MTPRQGSATPRKNSPRERRISFVEFLNGKKIDSALITDPRDIYYLSGYSAFWPRQAAFLILTHGDSQLLVGQAWDKKGAANAKNVFEDHISTFVDYELHTRMITYEGTVARELERFLRRSKPFMKSKRIGLEDWHISRTYFETVQKAAPRSKFANISDSILNWRKTKGTDELTNLKTAAKRLDLAYQTAKENIKPGKSELALCSEVSGYSIMRDGPFEFARGDTWLSGERTLEIGGPPSDRTFKIGDGVLMDLQALYNNYWADGARTYIVGKPTEAQERIFNVVLAAKEKGEEMLRPGTTSRDVYYAVANEIKKAGYSEFFPHHAGHGLGLEVQEGPFFIPACKDKLEENQVCTLEPGIYHPAVGGFRDEDTYIITKKGYEKFTTSTSKLEGIIA